MFCKRSSTDPIAQRLHTEDKFILLGRGFSKEELMAGMIVRQPAEKTGRDPVVDSGAMLFDNWPKLPVTRKPYTRLQRGTSSNSLKASAAADLAPTLAGNDEVAAVVKGAFERSMIDTLTVALTGAIDSFISEAYFERRCLDLVATETAKRYSIEKQKFFLITRAISVTSAVITLENEKAAEGLLEGSAHELGRAGLKAKVETGSSRSVVLQNANQDETVIAIKCVEILLNSNAEVNGLQAPKGKLEIRAGDDFEPTYATLDELGHGDDALFVRLNKP